MNTPTGSQIIDFVLNGPAGRGADPMDPDKRRATAEEVEKFVYGGTPIDWAHLADIASAARHHAQFSEFPWITHPIDGEVPTHIQTSHGIKINLPDAGLQFPDHDLPDGANEYPGG